jgi:hypothetical protein
MLPLPCGCQRDFGIRAEAEHVCFAGEAIADAPELRAGRIDLQMKAEAMGEFVRFVTRASRSRWRTQ